MEIWLDLRAIIREEFFALEMTIREKFPIFLKIFTPGQLVIPPKLQARVIEAAHEGHMKERKTIGTLRERNWFPRLSKMAKEYVESCIGCAAGDTHNPPAPLSPRSMPGKPWQEVAVDFKGPIGGSKGYYFHV